MNEKLRVGLEESFVFMAIISPGYINDPEAVEYALYAKQLGKPMFLLIQEGTEIPDLFKDCDIRLIHHFDKKEGISKNYAQVLIIMLHEVKKEV